MPKIVIIVLLGVLIMQVGMAVQARITPPPVTSLMSWAFQPQTLKELYDLSDTIVIAKVTGVAPGPQLVSETTSPDHPTMTRDTMLITVSVMTLVKGAAGTDSEMTIYRQVHVDQNTHKIGETYLLFLRNRVESTSTTDGSYFIVAAEGNYHIVNNQLIWDWKEFANNDESFAAKEVDAQPLDRVLQEIDSLK